MKKIMGIEVCDDSLRLMCRYYSAGKFIIDNYSVVEFNEKIANDGRIIDFNVINNEILRFKTENFITCDKINVLLNSSKIVIRNISINLKTEKECRKYVELNKNNIFPMSSLNDYLVDYKVNEVLFESEKNLIITAVAAPHDLLNQYISIFNSLKLKPVLFDIYENSIVRLFKHLSSKEKAVIVTLDFYSYCCQIVFLYCDFVIERIFINTTSINFIDKFRMYVSAYRATNVFGEIKAFYLLGRNRPEPLVFEEFNIDIINAKFIIDELNVEEVPGIIGVLIDENDKSFASGI